MGKLDEYLDQPVRNLVADSTREFRPEEQERQRIYALLLMAMIAYNWNSNKRGVPENLKPSPTTDYGLNPILSNDATPVRRALFLKNDYLGHNIAALAVDREGAIIDFDFNHNEIFNSSVQHAEARLLNRLFSLNQISDTWNMGSKPDEPSSYGQLLQGVSVYTSLESCAQCSGIMTLGNAREVVYLQEDPGQYKIGNIMYRLTESSKPNQKALAPRPVPASAIGFAYYRMLNEAFNSLKASDGVTSITTFLCTEVAYRIFLEAEKEFSELRDSKLQFPTWQLTMDNGILSPMTNAGVLQECQGFYWYFARKGKRGTPH